MSDTITVCSIAPESYLIRRAYLNQILIPAKPDGAEYSATVITNCMDHKVFWQTLEEKEIVDFEVRASDIVRDIMQSEQLEDKGVFALPAGRTTPTEKELATARKKRQDQLIRWALEGDRTYSKFGERGIQHIPDYCKRAVEELGEKRGWVFSASKGKTQCKGCGKSVDLLNDGTEPAICSSCGAPINKALAVELGLWAPPEPQIKRRTRGPNKPKAQTQVQTAP